MQADVNVNKTYIGIRDYILIPPLLGLPWDPIPPSLCNCTAGGRAGVRTLTQTKISQLDGFSNFA